LGSINDRFIVGDPKVWTWSGLADQFAIQAPPNQHISVGWEFNFNVRNMPCYKKVSWPLWRGELGTS